MKEPITHTLDPETLSTGEMHNYLLSAIGPRPIAFASTIDSKGNVNLSPFSFFNVFSANPPILVFSPARRGRDNTTKHTYENIKEIPEVTINIVNYPMVEQMSLASTEYAKGVNEFDKSGFTEVPSKVVKPPYVKEAPVSFECTVDQVIELGDQGGAGNLVLARVKMIHIRDEYTKEGIKLDPTKLDLVGRMGESWYCHAGTDSMFEIPKPIQTKGIGVDHLSQSIRNSNILTSNHRGRLGNLEKLPSEADIKSMMATDEIKQILLEFEDQRDLIKDELHRRGVLLIEQGFTQEALTTLLIVDHV